jgi:hypothetical protein
MIGTNRYIGSPIERIEDLRFLRGRGQFVGDLKRESMLHAAILRSVRKGAPNNRTVGRERRFPRQPEGFCQANVGRAAILARILYCGWIRMEASEWVQGRW